MREPARPPFCVVVEDDPTIGLDLVDALSGEGWFVAGPFTRGQDALDWLSRFTPDIAVVSLRMRDGLSREIIAELERCNVPVVRLAEDHTVASERSNVGSPAPATLHAALSALLVGT